MKLVPAEELAFEHGRYVAQVAPLRPHEAYSYVLPPKGIYVETKGFAAESTIVKIMKLRCTRPHYKGKCSFVPAG